MARQEHVYVYTSFNSGAKGSRDCLPSQSTRNKKPSVLIVGACARVCMRTAHPWVCAHHSSVIPPATQVTGGSGQRDMTGVCWQGFWEGSLRLTGEPLEITVSPVTPSNRPGQPSWGRGEAAWANGLRVRTWKEKGENKPTEKPGSHVNWLSRHTPREMVNQWPYYCPGPAESGFPVICRKLASRSSFPEIPKNLETFLLPCPGELTRSSVWSRWVWSWVRRQIY